MVQSDSLSECSSAMVSIFLVVALASAAEYVCTERAPLTSTRPRPSVDGGTSLFIGGKLTPWEGKVVDVLSPVYGEDGTQAVIGSLSAMDGGAATTAARAAAAAWDLGQGPWPQSSLKDRAAALGAYLDELEATARDAIIETLMWEIAKSEKDAAKEFDRTVAFARTVIATALEGDAAEPFGAWTGLGGVRGRVRRGPVGVALMLAPFNYPLNEMYAMMMPALLMGNCVILKLPAIGALAHVLTIEAIRKTLPPGVVNFVSGSGRATLPSVMASGVVDCLGFIGGSKGADRGRKGDSTSLQRECSARARSGKKHPRFETVPRDDRSSKNQPKRAETGRARSL